MEGELVGRQSEQDQPKSIVAAGAAEIQKYERIVQFRGRPMVLDYTGYPHFVPLHKERFDKIGYPILGGQTRSRMNDIYSYIGHVAEDLTEYENYMLFGLTEVGDDGEVANLSPAGITSVWDMEDLCIASAIMPPQCVWRSPYAKVGADDGQKLGVRDEDGKIRFVMDLADNDAGVYDDIMQSLAPLVMARKPDGVIWWVGDGANGKSTLMDAIYKIFPGQLSSLTVKRLVDGRDTPSLNGTLANVVKESSEGRVDDTEVYKAIGTHENFRVHKFHSQDDVEVRGNVHHIFSANSIPAFNDKGYSARRRTFIIPFTARFESDPTFEERTFTPELFGCLIMEMCAYANKIKRQGYKYKWSARTLAAKLDYDTEANNAEEYTKEIIDRGVVAFDSYNQLRIDYENWCADRGYVPLGIGNLRKATQTYGFERSSRRLNTGRVDNIYRLASVPSGDLQQFSMTMPGMYTTYGFKQEGQPEKEAEPEKPKQTSILGGKW